MKSKTCSGIIVLCMMMSMNAGAEEMMHRDSRGTVSVTGTASESYPPDTAEIVLAVETKDKTVSEATRKNREAAEKVISKLKRLLDIDKGDRVKTSSYSVSEDYEYDNISRKNKSIGFRVVNEIMIKTARIQDAGALIDKAVEEGANRVSTIRFTITDDRAFCNGLLKAATARAKSEAEAVAQSLGVKISGVKDATASCSSQARQPAYPYQMAARSAAAMEESATPIEAGETLLRASVATVFYLDKE